jgi:putative RecB family exonuclease
MARPSAQSVRDQIDLERQRNADLVGAASEPLSHDMPAQDIALAVLGALANWWHDESVALESSTKRADATNRREYRIAARQAAAIAASIRMHGCAGIDVEPAPTVPALSVCGATYDSTAGELWTCSLPSHPGKREHTMGDKHWFDDPDASASVTTEVAAYLAGETDLPPTLSPDPIPERTPEPVQPIVQFIDPPLSGAGPTTKALTFADLAQPPSGEALTHRSVSQLQSFADCGLKYRLQRRESVSPQPQWAFIGGRALHAAIEEMERQAARVPSDDWASVRSSLDLDQLWQTHLHREMSGTMQANPDWPMDSWRASARGAEHYTWWRAEGIDMLNRYVAWRTELARDWAIARTPDGTPIIEYEFMLDVDGVPVKGVIDQAWRHRGTGQIMIIDVKAGKSKPDDDLQLRTYGQALVGVGIAVLNGPDDWSGAYWQARKGALTEPVPVAAPGTWAEIHYRVHAMDAADRANIHLPRPSSFCGGCSVKHACPLRGH